MKAKEIKLSQTIYPNKWASLHSSTKWLMADVVAISLVLALLNIAGHPLLLSYQWHKLLHIFGMVNSFIHNQDDYLKKK